MMKAGNGEHFEQCYNAQAAVEVESRLIVGERVTNAPNDKQQLAASFQAVAAAAGPVAQVLVDSGYFAQEAIRKIEQDEREQPTGVQVLAALKREHHGRSVAQLKKKEDPPPPGADASIIEEMAHRVATREGGARYKLRQQTVEPVFGIIKETLGFRRFSLRGQAKAALERTLVALAYNFKRLFTLGTKLSPA